MITITGLQIEQYMLVLMLASVRIFGLFLTAPMFAFRALPMQFRVLLTLLLAFYFFPFVGTENFPTPGGSINFFFVMIELATGAFIGFMIRLGLMAVDVAAEVLSFQAGFSFASTFFNDPMLDSGLVGQFLGLIMIALCFALNIHLLVLDLVLSSFKTLPFGVWPSQWSIQGVIDILTSSFRLGLILAMPVLLVYIMFNMTQAFLGRTSPQMNLFSVGFAISIPLAFLVLVIVLPDLPDVLKRSLEEPMQLIRQGLGVKNGP
jgi:flagellar biosynthetic protein FliR